MFEVGRLCIKTAGREAGRPCVVVKKLEENFVLITGPKIATKVRRRRCNIEHLEPLEIKINIKADTDDNEILGIYEKEGIFEKLGIEKPSPEKMKLAEERKRKKAAEKKLIKEEAEKKKGVKKAKSPETVKKATLKKEAPAKKKPEVSKKTISKTEKKEAKNPKAVAKAKPNVSKKTAPRKTKKNN